MDSKQIARLLVKILLIAGGLNWLSIAYNGVDMVSKFAGPYGQLDRYIKFAVGGAALLCIYELWEMSQGAVPMVPMAH